MAVTGCLWGRDIADLLKPGREIVPGFEGFDAEYCDIVDYILRCTHRIWEQKDIGLIETHYGNDCPIHLPTGSIAGVDTVVEGTLKTLAGFPDRTLIGEAIIWSDEGDAGYLSSHRITSTATNLGASEFGAATGRRVSFTTIADCLCKANLIVEEWLVRDNSAILLQLGVQPRMLARAQAAQDRAASSALFDWRRNAIDAVRAQSATPFPAAIALPDPAREPQAFTAIYVDAIFNHRRLGLIRSLYADTVQQRLPGGRSGFGHGEVIGWLTALLASFPDARMTMQHLAVVQEGSATDVAMRWEIAATHSGSALYGAPSNRDIWILGITHWRIENGLVTDELMLFDEVALLRQIEGGL